MNEKFNKNAKVEKFTTMLGIAVRLIVIDPSCTQWDSNPQPSDWTSDSLPTELANDLITYMYSQYQHIPCYKYENDDI